MKKTTRDISLILIGTFLLAIGMNYFLIPNMLSEGGVIGLTIIIHYMFDISPGLVNFFSNIALVAFGFRFFDKRSIVYT